jgi:hypothetical protein
MKAPIKSQETPAPKASFSFPQEAASAIKNAQETVVGLPFPLTVWYIKNGSPQAKAIGGTAYTGGWACGDIPQAGLTLVDYKGEDRDLAELFEERVIENVNQEGNAYETVELQALEVAPFLHRRRFVEGRSHTQVLALLRLPGEIVSMCMLSARGYQSGIVLDEIGKVASGTAVARKELGNPPPALFWHKIGMPSKPDFRSVGKAATSLITPVKAVISNENLEECYIGDELALVIAETIGMEEVLIWRDAWSKANQQQPDTTAPQSGPKKSDAFDIPF